MCRIHRANREYRSIRLSGVSSMLNVLQHTGSITVERLSLRYDLFSIARNTKGSLDKQRNQLPVVSAVQYGSSRALLRVNLCFSLSFCVSFCFSSCSFLSCGLLSPLFHLLFSCPVITQQEMISFNKVSTSTKMLIINPSSVPLLSVACRPNQRLSRSRG